MSGKVTSKIPSKMTSKLSITKIKASDDIEINGRVYFVPDKYIENTYLPTEFKKLYKFCFAMYLDMLITNHKIENINNITKLHITHAIQSSEKILNYIVTGKVYIINISLIEKTIIENIPESLLLKINTNIIEKIEI
jgi:hypothetical protein